MISPLLQAFSAGAESGGVSVYLAEIAKPGHRGLYVSWQSASRQISVVFAARHPPEIMPETVRATGFAISTIATPGLVGDPAPATATPGPVGDPAPATEIRRA
ncbi:hypothetical protein [Saccharopolyspora phatthalungensis]|uniref:MFS family permease n=1 Tax=Saccharopolyspora phatthalungensis TaxID=664693 RepID=A0A840QFI9_9PSEU|nr:hypothetical protein [Saccharopolyspora phatthalungensis]MBB5158690.1 MFS family permease [Saccharopolyspora phatthalungensis]